MTKARGIRVRCPRCGETLERERFPEQRQRGGKRGWWANDWSLWDVIERQCPGCRATLRIDARQLRLGFGLAKRAGQGFVVAVETDAPLPTPDEKRRVEAALDEVFRHLSPRRYPKLATEIARARQGLEFEVHE